MIWLAPLCFALGIVAWWFSTLAAGGAATLLLSPLAFLLGAQAVAPTIAIASLVASPTRVWLFRHYIHWPIARWMIAGSIVGAMAGSYALITIATQNLEIAVGLFLMSTLLQNKLLLGPFLSLEPFADKLSPLRIRRPIWFLPIALSVSFISGLIGAAGPLFNPFLLNFGLAKEHLVGTKAANTLVMQVTKLASYLTFGLLSMEVMGYGVALGLGGAIGVYCGRTILFKISQSVFVLIVTGAMFISGLVLFLRGLEVLG